MLKKTNILILVSLGLAIGARFLGLSSHQAATLAIFSFSIFGTLFFWSFRLGFAFLGASALLLTKSIDLEHFIEFASLEVILFLVGMMVLIGLLKRSGFLMKG